MLRAISKEQYSIWSWFLVHLCEMMTAPVAFFSFSKFWFSGLLGGRVNVQKTAQIDKKICLLHSISEKPYIIWMSFMVNICKKFFKFFFHFFKILIFWFHRGVKGQNRVHNDKYSVCCTPYLRNHTSYDCNVWYTYVKWWYLQQIFPFFLDFWDF